MERPVKGKTLLVGEGDFSFTVAMVTNFPATAKEEVVSSSIETAESILKHKNAVENMKMLQENGKFTIGITLFVYILSAF